MRRLLWLYPRPWRDRYEAEFVALLDELEPTPALVADVAIGALAAHVHQRGERMIRAFLALLVLGTTALAAFGALHAAWLDPDASAFRALAAISFAVPVAVGLVTLLALVQMTPGSRHWLARTTLAAGLLLVPIGTVGAIGVLFVARSTGDYEWGIATANAALVVQGVLTALYFSGRLGGAVVTRS